MTHRWIQYAALIVLPLLSHACATPGPEERAAPETDPAAIHAGSDFIAPPRLSPASPLPALASFDELIETLPGELQVFRWDRSPQVFVFLYPDLAAQARALNRVAAFVEKAHAPRDRVLSDAELSATIRASGETESTYYVGHDYPAAALAAFFNAVPRSGVQLNPQEQDLRSRLLQWGFFAEAEPGRLVAPTPERVLISIAPERSSPLSAQDRRLKWVSVLRHELSHAEFFVDPAYRDYCLRAWQALPEPQRAIFTEEFARLGYDTANTLLLANEFQAFLWEPLVGFIMDVKLKKQNSSLALLRADFLAKLKSFTPSVTSLFDLSGFSAPIVWREQNHHLAKVTESIQ